ncbi:MAG: hypothetical protein HJJLKODD_00563 [Phycisphaerae bacterium]|nr:hypothetical protein [Phycisphaerae bacterium]
MGWITQKIRNLTDTEIEILDRHKRLHIDHHSIKIDLLSNHALEFDIGIEDIRKVPCNYLSKEKQAYFLNISSALNIGFELCFMDRSVVLGSFPKNKVRVAFAVQNQNNERWRDISSGGFPVLFDWYGELIEIHTLTTKPDWDKIVPIYRLEALLKAIQQLTT